MQLKLTLEYDGTGFRGWAAQPGQRTVEGEVRSALDAVYGSWDELAVAGRTDAGVHALGQVASVQASEGPPPDRAAEALNAELPDGVSVIAVEEAPSDFHARRSAKARSYRYRIYRRRAPSPFEARRAWWYPRPFDRDALTESAALLLGEHDFRAFTPRETQHKVFQRRVLNARWMDGEEDRLELEITADSFLRHMVRTLVGTMLELPPDTITKLLDGAERAEAGTTAPPWGLYLERVEY